jgi:hypothetical protein
MDNNIPTNFIVGNPTFTIEDLQKLPSQVVNEISIEMPGDFVTSRGRKYIKIFGCSLTLMEHVVDTATNQINVQIFNPLHTTLHSNIVNMTNTYAVINKNIKFESDDINNIVKLSSVNHYNTYISTTNNFLNPKIYELVTNNQFITFKFIDQYGNNLNLLEIVRDENNNNKFISSFQCLYKIEMQLLKE